MEKKSQINCVIFDWAGTTVDYGCFAPVAAFINAFNEIDITVTPKEARGPMGMTKIDHIRELFKLETVSSQFTKTQARAWSEADVTEINKNFEKYLFASLDNYTTPIDGVLDVVSELRSKGYKIGSTSGYTSAMMEIVSRGAAAKGYTPDCYVTSNNLPAGRPSPYMIYQNMLNLAVDSPNEIIKVGDTISDIKEGVNAGAWSVGIILGSSELGLSQEEVEALPQAQLDILMLEVRQNMLANGAHFVIDTMSELPALIDYINAKGSEQKPLERPYLLLTPGPLTTSDRVKRAMLADWCTWDADYNVNIVQDIRKELLNLACVDDSTYTTVLLQGSGTYCVESAISCSVGCSTGGSTDCSTGSKNKLLVVANGAYGERIGEIANYANINHTAIILKETEQVTPAIIEKALAEDSEITHVAVVHCETTTGIINPLSDIAKVVKQAGKVFIVDAMSSFGGIPIDMKQLDIDLLISSANKCIQGVPGFGFVIAKREIIEQCKGNSSTLSLDLYSQWNEMEKGNGKWRFTSPTHVVRAFAEALKELSEEGGIKARHQRYVANQQILVEGMQRAGYEALLPLEQQSPIITSFIYPSSAFEFKPFYDELKSCGFVLYPGKISQCDTFRIGNIGDVFPADMRRLVAIIQNKTISVG